MNEFLTSIIKDLSKRIIKISQINTKTEYGCEFMKYAKRYLFNSFIDIFRILDIKSPKQVEVEFLGLGWWNIVMKIKKLSNKLSKETSKETSNEVSNKVSNIFYFRIMYRPNDQEIFLDNIKFISFMLQDILPKDFSLNKLTHNNDFYTIFQKDPKQHIKYSFLLPYLVRFKLNTSSDKDISAFNFMYSQLRYARPIDEITIPMIKDLNKDLVNISKNTDYVWFDYHSGNVMIFNPDINSSEQIKIQQQYLTGKGKLKENNFFCIADFDVYSLQKYLKKSKLSSKEEIKQELENLVKKEVNMHYPALVAYALIYNQIEDAFQAQKYYCDYYLFRVENKIKCFNEQMFNYIINKK